MGIERCVSTSSSRGASAPSPLGVHGAQPLARLSRLRDTARILPAGVFRGSAICMFPAAACSCMRVPGSCIRRSYPRLANWMNSGRLALVERSIRLPGVACRQSWEDSGALAREHEAAGSLWKSHSSPCAWEGHRVRNSHCNLPEPKAERQGSSWGRGCLLSGRRSRAPIDRDRTFLAVHPGCQENAT